MNQSKMIVRKGGNCAAGVPSVAIFRGTWDVPAGMDSYEPQQVLAMQSFIEGVLAEEAGEWGQTLITGTL
jgi:hypothetical protein